METSAESNPVVQASAPSAADRPRRRRPRSEAAPVQIPATTLRVRAALLSRALRRPERVPRHWRSAHFAREADLVRLHLQPIHSLEMLAASYGREAFHRTEPIHQRHAGIVGLTARSAAEVGYAARWLELSGELGATSWLDLVAVAEARSTPES